MKRNLTIGVLSCVAAISAYGFISADPLKTVCAKMFEAQSIRADFSYMQIGDAAKNYSVVMKKPNQLRFDGPQKLIVADGTTITTLDKKSNKFFKKPQSESELAKVFSADGMAVWAPFFNQKAMANIVGTSGGKISRKGKSLDVIKAVVDAQAGLTLTLHVDPANGLPMQAIFENKKSSAKANLLDASFLAVNDATDVFAFKAPNGAQEVNEADLMTTTWFHNLDEAKSVAAASGRRIFVDFYADWCGPCKMLAAEVFSTAEFKELGSKLVFCKINVDEQKAVAQQFGISAIPDCRVLEADGTMVGKLIGYKPAGPYLEELRQYVK